ncbi:MAG: zinc dependent phospholipase C family protein, partial [Acidobacteriaceae bacterium]|nr:zinc dependent phospholipase C family protein [Acidobacteriaceae bacterium]
MRSARPALAAIIALLSANPARAYAVLSHEALVDALWDTEYKHVLLLRFPHATASELKEAHSYAYGGAAIQDMGFYPHNNGYFSDLTHYVRSADFILRLIADSQTLDEYAFALGALSHYYGDNVGHGSGTNKAEPLLYPKLRREYGNVLTYADNPSKHLQT